MNKTRSVIFIAFGGNLGDPVSTLKLALPKIAQRIGEVLRVSKLVETKALTLNGEPQPNYINAVIELVSNKGPEDVLAEMLLIEQELGRQRSESQRWEPRTIDLDLLLVGDTIMDTETLKLPHPEMCKRDFVLQPLRELAPDLRHPVLQKTIRELEAALISEAQERFVVRSLPESFAPCSLSSCV